MMVRKFFCISVLLSTLGFFLCADSYSGSQAQEAIIIRAPVWVFLEPQPGVMKDDSGGAKLPPRQALAELSAFVLEGMTYGWRFSYTPFDKKRKVAEEFMLTPVQTVTAEDSRLHLTELRPHYPYLYCWAEYRITDAMALRKQEWKRINYITSKGSGSGNRKNELDGVRQAYTEAALNAVRTYLRKNEKSKPKQIIGEMFVKENPRLYAAGGKFKAELTVYLFIKEIIPYTVF